MEMNLKDTVIANKKSIIAASCLVLIVAGSAVFFGFSAKKNRAGTAAPGSVNDDQTE